MKERFPLPIELFVVLACMTMQGRVMAATDGFPVDGVALFRNADTSWDFHEFTNAAAFFERASVRYPESWEAHYWLGVSLFHAVLVSSDDAHRESIPNDMAKRLVQQAAEALDTALAVRPDDAESHALLAVVTGMRIRANRLSALWLGPAVLRHRDKALQDNPRNPRVYYLIGTTQYYAPGRLGSRDKGLALLLNAARLFEEERVADRPASAPRWGDAHCLAFIGKIYQEQNDIDKALHYYGKALELNPCHGMAMMGLDECRNILQNR